MATMVAPKSPSRICLSGKVKKKQFGKYGLRAYLGRYNVNIAKTSFLTDKLGDKLVLGLLPGGPGCLVFWVVFFAGAGGAGPARAKAAGGMVTVFWRERFPCYFSRRNSTYRIVWYYLGVLSTLIITLRKNVLI